MSHFLLGIWITLVVLVLIAEALNYMEEHRD